MKNIEVKAFAVVFVLTSYEDDFCIQGIFDKVADAEAFAQEQENNPFVLQAHVDHLPMDGIKRLLLQEHISVLKKLIVEPEK